MTLAMDIEDYIEREGVNRAAEGEARASRDIAVRLLQRGIAVEQIVDATGLTVEEVRELSRKQ